jgi:hypothetical protein
VFSCLRREVLNTVHQNHLKIKTWVASWFSYRA